MQNNPLGIYEKALINGPINHLLTQTKLLGFSFLELSIDESAPRLARLDWSTSDCQIIRRTMDETEIRIPSICLSGNRLYPLGSSNQETRKTGIQMVRRAIALADKLGVRIIQIAGYERYYEEATGENDKLYLDSLSLCLAEAARYCITLAVETMDTSFMSSISRFLWSKSQLPSSPWLSVYPDVGNISAQNTYPLHDLELGLASGDVAAIHIKDTLAQTCTSKGQFRDVEFGEGCVDFPGFLKVLSRYNYCGPFVLEMWNREQKSLDQAKNAKSWFEMLIKEV